MTYAISKLLAIVDPTTDDQRALRRALHIARRGGAAVHAFLSCHSTADAADPEALRRVEVARNGLWLDDLLRSMDTEGVTVTQEVAWSDDWRASFASAAERAGCDAIVKSTHTHSAPRRRLLKTSDWALLRSAHCPVLLVKRASVAPSRRILVAVNPGVEDAAHQALNVQIADIGRTLTEGRGDLELHAVCAYSGSDRFTHPPELAEFAGIDESRAHCKAGDPEDVITALAAELDAELVVLGTVGRSGLGGLTKGNTAERILDRLETDVLVVAAT